MVALGDEYYNDKNYSLAASTFERAADLGTKEGYVYYGLAKSYRACDLDEKAASAYEKAIALSPDNLITVMNMQNLFRHQISLL